ncbi:hypothetical protein BU16DRAFT_581203 [Lophium mytilinum]|uniref:DUF7791 domain-containing protein n=1 Tax=Lophium mytilinum TaxID=390894 RepID=A0A6A6QZ04_9PEZI|nr:hypothetical protein BU16DRAFT_581203 [Lophium mytilinum]
MELVDFLICLTKSPNIKVCLSSRPWNVFENAFEHLTRKLRVQDLTRDDIRCYVRDSINQDARFAKLKVRDPRSQDLVEEIVDKADGVFLWVVLVVRSLKQGLLNADNIATLRKRLRKLPGDLDKFFRHILNQVEDVYWEGTTQAFEMALTAQEPLPLQVFSVLDEENPDHAVSGLIPHLPPPAVEDALKDLEKRLDARCKGLLEVCKPQRIPYGDNRSYWGRITVNFLHRTARDFLRIREVQQRLHDRLETPFDANEAICKGYLIQIRSLQGGFHDFEGTLHNITFYAPNVRIDCQRAILDTFSKLVREVHADPSEAANSECDLHLQRHFVQKGLHDYLRDKLQRNPHALTPTPEHGRKLLYTALFPNEIGYDSREERNAQILGSPEMVRLLIESGCNLVSSDPGSGTSPVEAFFSFLRSAAVTPERQENWYQLIDVFIPYLPSTISWVPDFGGLAQFFDVISTADQAMGLKALLPEIHCSNNDVHSMHSDELRCNYEYQTKGNITARAPHYSEDLTPPLKRRRLDDHLRRPPHCLEFEASYLKTHD